MKYLFESLKQAFFSIYSWIIDFLSFNTEIESLVDALNHKLEEPPGKMVTRPFSHPGGFIRELGKRRLSIAGAYIKIARDLSPEDVDERLGALRILVEQSLHAKTINMPLNTARVQIDLMKEAVKNKGNKRIQMEAMADFGLASFGQEAVIRSFLNKRNLVEVPEEDLPLKDLNMGWDDHVHDTLSEGRKTPTQVLLDAFVKGISELTLVYSNINERRMIHEAIAAGNILGIKVNIGIEFSVGKSGTRRHYMYVPPYFPDSKSFWAFFDQHNEMLLPFHEGLRKNVESRRKTMEFALDRFNLTHRARLNEGFEPDSPCWIPPVKIEDLDKIVACGQVSRIHIGELLYQRLKDAFQKRVLFLKAQYLAARERFNRGVYSEWELKNITAQYESVREKYVTMNPENLRSQYIDPKDVSDYDSAFISEEVILPLLRQLPGKIVQIHPIEMGLKDAMVHVLKFAKFITHVEVINLHDSINRNPNDLTVFNKFIYILNNRPVEEMKSFLEKHGIENVNFQVIEEAKRNIGERGIVPICGSDSTGRDPTIPGMGFIKLASIPKEILPVFKEHHYKLPRPIADLINHKGKKNPEAEIDIEKCDIICMGKQGKPFINKVGDEEEREIIDLVRFWTYLNPTIKEFIRVIIGFFVAWQGIGLLQTFGFFQNCEYLLGIGIEYGMLWLTITFFRNVLVDLIAASGLDITSWNYRNVNFDNASQSLFWTGFSVPILNTVKKLFDQYWCFSTDTLFFHIAKFFFLCFANGLYIFSHNTLRNFDSRVKRVNFFRSILAWPFATAFHGIGDFFGIPSVVQTKFWSDVVAGFIEGSGKYHYRFVLRQRDLSELLPRLESPDRDSRLMAMLDILYIWAVQPRGKSCLAKLLAPKKNFWTRWFRKVDLEEEKKNLEIQKRYIERLINIFGDPGCMTILSEFVLKNYHGSDAGILTELIGKHCESFLTWLRAQNKLLPS